MMAAATTGAGAQDDPAWLTARRAPDALVPLAAQLCDGAPRAQAAGGGTAVVWSLPDAQPFGVIAFVIHLETGKELRLGTLMLDRRQVPGCPGDPGRTRALFGFTLSHPPAAIARIEVVSVGLCSTEPMTCEPDRTLYDGPLQLLRS